MWNCLVVWTQHSPAQAVGGVYGFGMRSGGHSVRRPIYQTVGGVMFQSPSSGVVTVPVLIRLGGAAVLSVSRGLTGLRTASFAQPLVVL